MRKWLYSSVILLFVSALMPPTGVAQNSPQNGLPDGVRARLGTGFTNEIEYSPDGARLAVASSIGIWLYDTATHQEVALLTGHVSGVESVAYSPEGETIASGSGDGTVRLWDANTGEHLQTLEGHTDWVFSVSYSPDGQIIASGARDGTIRLWDADTGEHLQTLKGHTSAVESVAYSPDGQTLVSGSLAGTALLWEVESSTGVEVGVEPMGSLLTTLGKIKRTALLQNYPNPFNPETWIPYQLAKDALVTLTIYDQRGHIVRTLDIGRQQSGVYRNKASAAYWDGRNQNGEPVTSGTYYYQLRAGDYTSLRRMVILK